MPFKAAISFGNPFDLLGNNTTFDVVTTRLLTSNVSRVGACAQLEAVLVSHGLSLLSPRSCSFGEKEAFKVTNNLQILK